MQRTTSITKGDVSPQEAIPLKSRAAKIKKISNGFVIIDANGEETAYPTFQTIHQNMQHVKGPRNVIEHLAMLFEEKDVGNNIAA